MFFGVSALLFAASATVTIMWCASMSDHAGGHHVVSAFAAARLRRDSLPMDPLTGGWLGAAAAFLGMWVVMMTAMMLPSLVPMLWRYRQAIAGSADAPRRRGAGIGGLTAIAGAGYFFVWTVFGMAAFALGAALATLQVQQPAVARAVPIAVGVVVLIAGALQFTAWKAHHLVCCREGPAFARARMSASFGEGISPSYDEGTSASYGENIGASYGEAWRHGLRLGLHCSCSCAGLTAVLLVIGVMDLRAMTVVAAAITIERLAPAGERVAHAIGAVVVGAGLVLIAQAAGLG